MRECLAILLSQTSWVTRMSKYSGSIWVFKGWGRPLVSVYLCLAVYTLIYLIETGGVLPSKGIDSKTEHANTSREINYCQLKWEVATISQQLVYTNFTKTLYFLAKSIQEFLQCAVQSEKKSLILIFLTHLNMIMASRAYIRAKMCVEVTEWSTVLLRISSCKRIALLHGILYLLQGILFIVL